MTDNQMPDPNFIFGSDADDKAPDFGEMISKLICFLVFLF